VFTVQKTEIYTGTEQYLYENLYLFMDKWLDTNYTHGKILFWEEKLQSA